MEGHLNSDCLVSGERFDDLYPDRLGDAQWAPGRYVAAHGRDGVVLYHEVAPRGPEPTYSIVADGMAGDGAHDLADAVEAHADRAEASRGSAQTTVGAVTVGHDGGNVVVYNADDQPGDGYTMRPNLARSFAEALRDVGDVQADHDGGRTDTHSEVGMARPAAELAASIVDALTGGDYTPVQREARAEFLRARRAPGAYSGYKDPMPGVPNIRPEHLADWQKIYPGAYVGMPITGRMRKAWHAHHDRQATPAQRRPAKAAAARPSGDNAKDERGRLAARLAASTEDSRVADEIRASDGDADQLRRTADLFESSGDGRAKALREAADKLDAHGRRGKAKAPRTPAKRAAAAKATAPAKAAQWSTGDRVRVNIGGREAPFYVAGNVTRVYDDGQLQVQMDDDHRMVNVSPQSVREATAPGAAKAAKATPAAKALAPARAARSANGPVRPMPRGSGQPVKGETKRGIPGEAAGFTVTRVGPKRDGNGGAMNAYYAVTFDAMPDKQWVYDFREMREDLIGTAGLDPADARGMLFDAYVADPPAVAKKAAPARATKAAARREASATAAQSVDRERLSAAFKTADTPVGYGHPRGPVPVGGYTVERRSLSDMKYEVSTAAGERVGWVRHGPGGWAARVPGAQGSTTLGVYDSREDAFDALTGREGAPGKATATAAKSTPQAAKATGRRLTAKQVKASAKQRTERPDGYPERGVVHAGKESWSTPDPAYDPQPYTADSVKAGPSWADPEDPRKAGREFESYEGPVQIDPATGRPLNPRGRTGIEGRGLLGRWGANPAADPIVTRYNPDTGKLEVALIRRGDSGEWAFPGGMVDPGEAVPATLAREFREETGADLPSDSGKQVYKGFVDDPRNTDNAWMETTATHFHLSDEQAAQVHFAGPDDQAEVKAIRWVPVDEASGLYASHDAMLRDALKGMPKTRRPAKKAAPAKAASARQLPAPIDIADLPDAGDRAQVVAYARDTKGKVARLVDTGDSGYMLERQRPDGSWDESFSGADSALDLFEDHDEFEGVSWYPARKDGGAPAGLRVRRVPAELRDPTPDVAGASLKQLYPGSSMFDVRHDGEDLGYVSFTADLSDRGEWFAASDAFGSHGGKWFRTREQAVQAMVDAQMEKHGTRRPHESLADYSKRLQSVTERASLRQEARNANLSAKDADAYVDYAAAAKSEGHEVLSPQEWLHQRRRRSAPASLTRHADGIVDLLTGFTRASDMDDELAAFLAQVPADTVEHLGRLAEATITR